MRDHICTFKRGMEINISVFENYFSVETITGFKQNSRNKLITFLGIRYKYRQFYFRHPLYMFHMPCNVAALGVLINFTRFFKTLISKTRNQPILSNILI
jgi:hypothetical protein